MKERVGERGGRGEYSIVACLGRFKVDDASLWRWSTVPTPTVVETPRTFERPLPFFHAVRKIVFDVPFPIRRLWPLSIIFFYNECFLASIPCTKRFHATFVCLTRLTRLAPLWELHVHPLTEFYSLLLCNGCDSFASITPSSITPSSSRLLTFTFLLSGRFRSLTRNLSSTLSPSPLDGVDMFSSPSLISTHVYLQVFLLVHLLSASPLRISVVSHSFVLNPSHDLLTIPRLSFLLYLSTLS